MDSNMRYSGGGVLGNRDPSEAGSTGGFNAEDPEDLTLPNSRSPPEVLSRIAGGAPPPSPLHGPVMAAKSSEAAMAGSRRGGAPEPLSAPPTGGPGGAAAPAGPNASTGSPILDTYLQLIAESQSGLQLGLSERAKLAAELRRRNNNEFPLHPAALGLGVGVGQIPVGLSVRPHSANDIDVDAASSDGEGDPDQGDTAAEYSEDEPEPIMANE